MSVFRHSINQNNNNMKKIFFFLTVIMTVIGFQSCTEVYEPQKNAVTQEKDYEVVYVDQTANTRADSTQGTEQILKFKDQEAYERTLEEVRAMSDSTKVEFFKKLGFDGAYMLLTKADEDIENAFDIAETVDSIKGITVIKDCVSRYEGVLCFNDSDAYDVTPNLPFVDENAELLGNKYGNVIVGEELVTPTAGETKAPYNGWFIAYDATVIVKNGKYKSRFILGRMGYNMAFRLETYRQYWFYKKYDKKCCYDGELEIYSNGYTEKATIKNARGDWKLYSSSNLYTPRVNMKMKNFSSTRNSSNKVSKNKYNILVK